MTALLALPGFIVFLSGATLFTYGAWQERKEVRDPKWFNAYLAMGSMCYVGLLCNVLLLAGVR